MSSDEPSPSASLHSYRLIAEIGRGGMANVYLAVVRGQNGFNKLVVVKRTRSDVHIDGDIQAMFLDEARLAARMNHPNVVQTYECGDDDGSYFITMEYLDGQPYSRVLSRLKGRMSLALHARVVADALSGLHHAHELRDFDGTPLNVVHRDATPHNVFVTYDGSIKVVDFGIAKALDSAAHTSTGVVKGKVGFMSPEQARGERLDRRTDVFAAGVMLFEAIAGRRMWEMPDLSVVHELMHGRVPSVHQLAAPEPLVRIVDRALRAVREERYATAIDMARDLETWIASTGERATARDVGELIAPAFDLERERVRQVIESQLKDLRWTGVQARVTVEDLPSLPLENAGVPDRPLPETAAPPPHVTTGSFVPTGSGAAVPMPLPPAPARGRSLAVPGVVAGLVAIAVVGLGLRFTMGSVTMGNPVGVPQTPPGVSGAVSGGIPAASVANAVDAAPSDGVTLTIRGKPADARILLDGMLLSVGPFEGKVLRTAKTRVVRIEAQDYVPKEQEVTFGADLVVTYDLAKVEAPRTGAGKPVVKQKHDIDSDSPYRHK